MEVAPRGEAAPGFGIIGATTFPSGLTALNDQTGIDDQGFFPEAKQTRSSFFYQSPNLGCFLDAYIDSG